MKESLYNYVFHYNHHTDQWHAIPRELYTQYWDNNELEGVLKAKDIKTLIQWFYEKN